MLRLIFLTALTSFLAHCGPKQVANIDIHTAPSLGALQLESVAVFPIRHARISASESQRIDRRVADGLLSGHPEIRLLGSSETVERLNQAGLTDQWATHLQHYAESGIPNTETVAEVGRALNVDGILQGEVVDATQRKGSRDVRSRTKVTVRYSLTLTRSAELLWEASSEGIRYENFAPPLIDALELAVDKIIAAVPLGKQGPDQAISATERARPISGM